MTARRLGAALILGTLGSALACAGQDAGRAPDLQTIDALRAEHTRGVNSGDPAMVLAGMTDDVVYLPPGQPPVLGKARVAAFIQPLYDQFDWEITMAPSQVTAQGDWAVEWGMLEGTATPLAGGQATTINGKYVFVYARQADGSWKITTDIFNDNAPPVATGE